MLDHAEDGRRRPDDDQRHLRRAQREQRSDGAAPVQDRLHRMEAPGIDPIHPRRTVVDGVKPPERAMQQSMDPVVEELRERALERDLGLPPGRLLDLGWIPLQDHDVRRAEAGGIDRDRDPLHGGLREQAIQHLLDGPGTPRAEVIDFAGLAALEQEPVAALEREDDRGVEHASGREHGNDRQGQGDCQEHPDHRRDDEKR